ncbi:hypothetical protein ACFL2V_12025 [Pseudomonadota bacterium]
MDFGIRFFLITALLFLPKTTLCAVKGDSSFAGGLVAEKSDSEEVGGVSLIAFSKSGHVGVSFTSIQSTQVLEASGRTEIYPFYLHLGG